MNILLQMNGAKSNENGRESTLKPRALSFKPPASKTSMQHGKKRKPSEEINSNPNVSNTVDSSPAKILHSSSVHGNDCTSIGNTTPLNHGTWEVVTPTSPFLSTNFMNLALQSPGSCFTPVSRSSKPSPSSLPSPMMMPNYQEASSPYRPTLESRPTMFSGTPNRSVTSCPEQKMTPIARQRFMSIGSADEHISLPKTNLTPRINQMITISPRFRLDKDTFKATMKESSRPPIDSIDCSKSNKACQSTSLLGNDHSPVDDYGYAFADAQAEPLSDDEDDDFFLCSPGAMTGFVQSKKHRSEEAKVPSVSTFFDSHHSSPLDLDESISNRSLSFSRHSSSNSLFGTKFVVDRSHSSSSKMSNNTPSPPISMKKNDTSLSKKLSHRDLITPPITEFLPSDPPPMLIRK